MVQVGDTLRLVCNYAVGGDQLYSIKWYKVRLATLSALQGLVQDNQEFYRFTPRDSPSAQQFGVEGVVVRLDRSAASSGSGYTVLFRSNDRTVEIRDISLKTAGTYMCEVGLPVKRQCNKMFLASASGSIPLHL